MRSTAYCFAKTIITLVFFLALIQIGIASYAQNNYLNRSGTYINSDQQNGVQAPQYVSTLDSNVVTNASTPSNIEQFTLANVSGSISPITLSPNATNPDPLNRNGISYTSASGRYNSNNLGTATDVDLSKYLGFSISPNSNYSLTLSTLQFTSQSSGTGSASLQIRTSLDNYTNAVATYNGLNTGNPISQTVTFDQTQYTNLTKTVGIRFYPYNASGGTGGTFSLNSTLTLNGSLDPTPAPPGIISAGIGFAVTGMGTLLRRRKQFKASKTAGAAA